MAVCYTLRPPTAHAAGPLSYMIFFNAQTGALPGIFVRIDGDVDFDCNVNLQDAGIVNLAFGSSMASGPHWDPGADFTYDGYVSLQDVSIVNANYGHHC
jgi:hypothetical protein